MYRGTYICQKGHKFYLESITKSLERIECIYVAYCSLTIPGKTPRECKIRNSKMKKCTKTAKLYRTETIYPQEWPKEDDRDEIS